MTNNSIKAAFQRMWQHVIAALNKKSSVQFITWESED